MVTHDPRATSFADRVVFLKEGALVRELNNTEQAHSLQPMMDVMAGLEM